MMSFVVAALVPGVAVASDLDLWNSFSDITLWNGASNVKWHQTNDPVMGGKSTGSFHMDHGLLKFKGEVVDVPKLHAPGFIKVETESSGSFLGSFFSSKGDASFADVSSCKAIVIKAKANENYDGYRLSFGTRKDWSCSFFSGGFKNHFNVPADGQFHEVKLSFDSFSNCNSDSTGEQTKTCASHQSSCPNKHDLRDVHPLGIWAEGKAGKVDLEVESIFATECSPAIVVAHGRNLRNSHQ